MSENQIQSIGTTPATKTLTARCYCKAVHFTLAVPLSSIPLKVHLCHCSICRYTHGTLCIFHAPLPSGVSPSFIAPSSLSSSLTAYRHAKASSTRYFCSTCSCHIGDVGVDDDEWVISASIFDANKDDVPAVWDIQTHVNTASAPGGGLYEWLPRVNGKEMKVWNPRDGAENAAIKTTTPGREVGIDGEEVLRAQCHCGGVSFTISRPKAAMLEEKAYEPWLSPVDPRKWPACLDACDDCRLQTGVHAIGWACIAESCIAPKVPGDLQLGGASKTFKSSEDVWRSFCGTCGASVMAYFNYGGARRQENGERLLNIAAGILRAPEGVLAEEWLTWRTGRVAWAESGMRYDAGLTEGLSEGMAEWGRENHGEAWGFNIG
ncbi:glutathione-dependent formaldehyde-activating enzyme [Colletotrichum orchidophilum]|uniref:Glutathione-dependent formaldehyde-activating enzyme n=1 Tax=Colletotrichum orchidophilum TaxID=1209926 RepID=A0A1G4ARX9_9PEZI|nr:glutathione-dependent formaldehyde-activating enzyme [Colletotrichum orchidophilum]OHE91865.1 glutathione-dependent formaldehyde-activating enzyme [Colletotrichum orchidophilum]